MKSFMEDFVDSIELDVAIVGERTIVDNTKEIYAGLYVAGMAANAVFGGPRMGPIFGGMLLSGEKVARMISERLEKGDLD